MTPPAPVQRDFGPQPLGDLLARHDLEPRHLVEASTEQLTFKAVSRALKGRRLTPNTIGKVLRALNAASGGEYVPRDCFTYVRVSDGESEGAPG